MAQARQQAQVPAEAVQQLDENTQALEQTPAVSQAAKIRDLIERSMGQIERALPKAGMTAERFSRVAMTTVRLNPDLMKCSAASLIAGIMQAAQLGLEPGPLGQAYLVPFWNKNTGQHEALFLIGYKGMVDLARRSGDIAMIYAQPVYKGDQFNYHLGLNPDLVHVPADDASNRTPDNVTHFYMVARFTNGGFHFGVMTKAEVDAIRARSKAGSTSYSPWNTDYAAMGCKTVLRREWKWLPVSVAEQKAVTADETVKIGLDADMLSVPDVEIVDALGAEEAAVAALAEAPAAPEPEADDTHTDPDELCPDCGGKDGKHAKGCFFDSSSE